MVIETESGTIKINTKNPDWIEVELAPIPYSIPNMKWHKRSAWHFVIVDPNDGLNIKRKNLETPYPRQTIKRMKKHKEFLAADKITVKIDRNTEGYPTWL